MSDSYRTIHYGIGAIGSEIVRLAGVKDDIEIVGVIDTGPDKAGRNVALLFGLTHLLSMTVSPAADPVLSFADAEIVIHSTGSYLEEVQPQLLAAVRADKNVISTCEELAYPWDRHPKLSAQLDKEAKAHGVTVVGTGVNPGFVMDTLVLELTAACQLISHIDVTRVVDVATRRVQLQNKVGAGLPLDEFRRRAETGRFGHVGLQESARLIAHGLGWKLDRVEETLEPVFALKPPHSEKEPELEKGSAAGVHQIVRAWMAEREVLRLDLQMCKGATDPRDEITIKGRPPINVIVRGGIQGEMATAAVVVNVIPAVVKAPPGLLTMADLPLITAFDPFPPQGGQGTQ